MPVDIAQQVERAMEGGASPDEVRSLMQTPEQPSAVDPSSLRMGRMVMGPPQAAPTSIRELPAELTPEEYRTQPPAQEQQEPQVTWDEIASSEDYRNLGQEERKKAMQRFYELMIAPQVPEEEQVDSLQYFMQKAQELDTQMSGKKEASFMDNFLYGYNSMPSDVQDWSLWLESRYPMGELRWDSPEGGIQYKTAEQLYGKEYMGMSPDDRRQFLLDRREKLVEESYSGVEVNKDSGWVLTGQLGGLLASPTTLLPAGATYKGAAAIGAGIGAQHAAAKGLAETGEIQPGEVALGATVGGVGAPVVLKAGRMVKSRFAKKANEKIAFQKLDEFERIVRDSIANGNPPAKAWRHAKTATGLVDEDIVAATKTTGKKIHIPSAREAARAVEIDKLSPKTSSWLGNAKKTVNKVVEPITASLKKIDPRLTARLRKMDYNTHKNAHEYLLRVDPFLKSIRSLNREVGTQLNKSLLDGDFNTTRALIRKNFDPKTAERVLKEFSESRKVLDELYKEVTGAGIKIGRIENYWPRFIKSKDQLFNSLGKKEHDEIGKLLEEAGRKKGATLTPMEESDVVNKYLRGYGRRKDPGASQFMFGGQRKITELKDEWLDFYATPEQSLHTYIRDAVNKVEKRKFFGRDIKAGAAAEFEDDLTGSVGNLVAKMRQKGEISHTDGERVKRLLEARFLQGEKAMSNFWQDAKNVGYSVTLGNPLSAMTQIGDLGYAMYLNGVTRTLTAALGKKHITAYELGLVDNIAEEFASTRGSARALNKLFKLSGFSKMDRLGKEAIMNSTIRKAWKQVKYEKGAEQLRKKWAPVFGDEFPQLMDDLANRRMTDNVKLMLWNQLAEAQPIALSEMPETYLNMQGGRVLYMLKSFTLKQINVMREDIARKLRTPGERSEGVKNLARYVGFISAANMTADQAKVFLYNLTGATREGELEKFIDDPAFDKVVFNVIKNFGASEWMVNQINETKISDAMWDVVLPPTDVLDAVAEQFKVALSGDPELSPKLVRQVPLIGKLWHFWFMGGAEQWEEREREREREKWAR